MWLRKLDLRDPVLHIALLLLILEYSVHVAGLDPILIWGAYVAHHFLELPGFFFTGLWLSRSLIPSEGALKAQFILFTLYFGWLLLNSGLNYVHILALNLVQWPLVLGFYSYFPVAKIRDITRRKR